MGKKDDRLNETRVNNNGEEMKIIRYGSNADIDIQFIKDGTVVEHRAYDAFKKGNIKNPMFPSVCGIGCIGIGKFKPFDENRPRQAWDSFHCHLREEAPQNPRH